MDPILVGQGSLGVSVDLSNGLGTSLGYGLEDGYDPWSGYEVKSWDVGSPSHPQKVKKLKGKAVFQRKGAVETPSIGTKCCRSWSYRR